MNPSRTWIGRRVLVAGGSGFIGQHLAERLAAFGAIVSSCSRREGTDLRDPVQARAAMEAAQPAMVFNCAANQGGVAYQQQCPGDILFDNTLIQLHTMDAARRVGVERYVNILPGCAYPAEPGSDGLYREIELDNGPLHPSADNYGITKRLAVQQARHYGRQFGLATTQVVLANTYGPRDHFDPQQSHVLAALLLRFRDAVTKQTPEVVVWGRGIAERDLLYVADAITGILLVVERCPDIGLVNVGSGTGHSVRQIAETVAAATGFRGKLAFDAARPEGPMRKVLDIGKLRAAVDWVPPTSLAEGVRQTLGWLEREERTMVAPIGITA